MYRSMRNLASIKPAASLCLLISLSISSHAAEKDAKGAAASKPKPATEPASKKPVTPPPPPPPAAPTPPAPAEKQYKFSDHVKTRAEVFNWLRSNVEKRTKDQFETTEQFNARASGYQAPEPILIELDSTFEYDADTETLMVRTSKFSNDVFLAENVIYSDNWPYVKQNVFVITSTNAGALGKHITNGGLEQSFKVPPQEARSIAKNMKLALQISFSDFKCARKQIKNPTYEGAIKIDQVNPIVEVFTVEGKIEHLSAFDGESGALKSDTEFE